MKKYLSIYLVFAMTTILVMVLGLHATPSYLMEKRNALYLKEAGGLNTFYHQDLPDAKFDAFVSPSPDLLYSYLVFDLSRTALLVEFPLYEDFWVNQMVGDNTDSFAYVGYKNQSGHPIKVVLYHGKSEGLKVPEDSVLIQSPSRTGTFLLRYLVRDRNDISQIDSIRKKVEVTALE